MSRAILALAATLLLAATAFTLAMAATSDDPAPTATAAPAPATPLMAAIDAALQDERAQVAALAEQLASAPDDAAALALHRAIEQAKWGAQVRVLAIQAEFARRDGRLEDAAEIDAAIAAMGRVEVPANIEARPAPSNTATTGR